FQAEDGIRDFHVTGVQTCALPIWGDQPPGTGPPCVEMIHHVATNEAGVAGHQEITHAGPPSLLRNLEWVSPDCRNCGSLMTSPSPLLSFLVFSVVSRRDTSVFLLMPCSWRECKD